MKPHRAPVFTDLYPSLAFYEEARKSFAAMDGDQVTGLQEADRVVVLKVLPDTMKRGNVPLPPKTPIVPEASGNITRIMLTVPQFLDTNDRPLKFRFARYPDHFSRLLKAFGPGVDWVIVSGERERTHVKKWLKAACIPDKQVKHVDSPRFNYSIWAQDPFLVLGKVSPVLLCEGVLFNREHDMAIVDDVDAQVRDIRAAQSYLCFQGGNVLGGKDVTLIGADSVWHNTDRFGVVSKCEVLDAFRRLVGTDVLPLGGCASGEGHWHNDGILSGFGFQPIFHIDMFVTPTGVVNRKGKEIVFLSRPREAYRLVGKYSEVTYLDTPAIDAFFTETHNQLAKRFEVRELPILSTRGNLGGREEFVRNYFLTWANALVEAGKKRVVLPSFVEHAGEFGLDVKIRTELQGHVEAAWRKLGFKVDVIDGVEDLAWGDGSIHCVAKVLARS